MRFRLRSLTCLLLLSCAQLFAATPEKEKATKPVSERTKKKESTQLPPVVVEAAATRSYVVKEAPGVARSGTKAFDLPFSVQMVPSQVMQDQGDIQAQDALRNVSGFHQNKGASFNSANDGGVLRGFQTTQMYYNGFLVEGMSSVNLPQLERLEILKGPASMEFGVVQPGGLVNMVTRRPSAESHTLVEQSFGSYESYRGHVDSTGALNSDKTLLYRVNGGYLDQNSFREYVFEKRYWLAPTITWRPSSKFSLTLDTSFMKKEKMLDEGVAFSAAGQPVGPISRFLGEPNLPGQTQRDAFAGLTAEWRPSDNLTFRSSFMYHHWDIDMNAVRRSANTSLAGTVARLYDNSDFSENSWQWMNMGIVKFDLGPTRHKLMAGYDYRDRKQTIRLNRANYTAVNIVSPVYGGTLPATSDLNWQDARRIWSGVYLQDEISMFSKDRLKLLVGGRMDYVHSIDYSRTGTPQTLQRIDRAYTGRAGLLYQPVHALGIYSSVSSSFIPSSTSSRNVSGGLLDPETGMQYEAGLKWRSPAERVMATMAVYHLTRDNVAIADPANPGFSINGGVLRSRGVEFDVSGQLTSTLQVIGNYTYTETRVIRSDTLPVGARFMNVPRNSGSLWFKYTHQDGWLRGFGVGFGIFAASNKSGDNNDTFKLPGYTRFDAALFYRKDFTSGPLSAVYARVNFMNLFDRKYYESSFGNSRAFPGQPFTVYATLGFEF
ncbi:TonB-dependent siderophore receptor [Prosthecobacter sp.]|uniref:TonB-dependent siderophore receptor n=1 Tax=Prosthecobacter sp. TaxID=1965333 RepID=UPI003783F504